MARPQGGADPTVDGHRICASSAIIDRVVPKRERTLYEISSSFFAGVVIVFALAGMLVVGFGSAGPLSGEFGICLLFLLLGLGRLYLGLVRGNEGADEDREN